MQPIDKGFRPTERDNDVAGSRRSVGGSDVHLCLCLFAVNHFGDDKGRIGGFAGSAGPIGNGGIRSTVHRVVVPFTAATVVVALCLGVQCPPPVIGFLHVANPKQSPTLRPNPNVGL